MKRNRKRKVRSRVNTIPTLSRGEMFIGKEIEHIVECAKAGDVHIVAIGPLIVFSAASGDAWMLEPDDGLALPLCRFGEPLPLNLVETSEQFTVEWTHTYSIQDGCFVAFDQGGARMTQIMDYPTRQISQATSRIKQVRPN